MTTSPSEHLSYPRLAALTQRFSLGVPTQLAVSPDGSRVLYVRSRTGRQREGLLWCLDVATGAERLLLDPATALHGETEHVPDEELARRERLRVGGAGVTAVALDQAAASAVVALSGRVFVVPLEDGSIADGGAALVEVPGVSGAVDPRLSPDGTLVAFHAHGGLLVAPADGSAPPRALVDPDGPAVTWGLSDFAHAEELARTRSFWWSPDSASLLVVRVDESPVRRWHIAEPARPEQVPQVVRYPAAGTPNVATSLWHVHLDVTRREVPWDHDALPYLVDVRWSQGSAALVTVLSRSQRHLEVLAWGATGDPADDPRVLRAVDDPAWVDVVPGVPAWWGERLLTVEVDRDADAYRLCADGVPLSPPDVQVRAVLGADASGVVVVAAREPDERVLARLSSEGRWTWLSAPGAVATGAAAGGAVVARVDTRDTARPEVAVVGGPVLPVLSEDPPWLPGPHLLPRVRPDDPRVAVLVPQQAPQHTGTLLPVLLDPYGGPHGLSVAATARAYLESQWWADQGYLVVVADGPGTPGSPAWERSMAGDLAGPAIAAQVRALEMVARAYGTQADLSRVAIRGWSFGGYLAALLVLERPDLVHAAVAGAPVTDWALYDTAYTERYLGLPQEHPERYRSQSLLERAERLRRPLLLVHGLADDNVVVAHTLTFSRALLEAGRAHRVLPLSGVTHMTPQAVVAENLLLLQRDFLAEALQSPVGTPSSWSTGPPATPSS